MFLDDQLLEICRGANAFCEEGIQKLNVDICIKCEEYYKSKIYAGMQKSDVRVILNRTFRLFDSFVRMAKADKDQKIQLLGDLMEKHTFKKQLLSNVEMRKIYESL